MLMVYLTIEHAPKWKPIQTKNKIKIASLALEILQILG